MSPKDILDTAPIGSVVAWSDGTPRPPSRFTKKLAAWQTRNSQGMLVKKAPERRMGNVTLPASFTLHEQDFGSRGVIVLRVFRTFSADTDLTFTILERPAVGSVRIFESAGEHAELVHLAADRAAAAEWLGRHGYPRAVLEDVTADADQATAEDRRAAA